MAQVIYIVCPLCGYNFPLEKKGTNARIKGIPLTKIKGRFRFDKVPVGEAIFEDVREGGGRGSGYVRIHTRTLKQILQEKDEQYKDIIQQLYTQSKKICKLIEAHNYL